MNWIKIYQIFSGGIEALPTLVGACDGGVNIKSHESDFHSVSPFIPIIFLRFVSALFIRSHLPINLLGYIVFLSQKKVFVSFLSIVPTLPPT